MLISQILIISMLVERIWEYVKLALGVDVGIRIKIFVSAALAIAAALAIQSDLLFALEITDAASLPGIIFTGVIIGLGSNLIHDILGLANSLKNR